MIIIDNESHSYFKGATYTMITVTNRFKLVKGMAVHMAPAFVQRNGLENFKGFRGIEINVSTQFEEYDKMNVMMYWDTREDFDAWHASDHFKNSHKREEQQHGGEAKKQSPIIENTVLYAELVAELVMN